MTWRGARGVGTMPLSIIGVLAVPEQPAQQPTQTYPTGVRIMDLASSKMQPAFRDFVIFERRFSQRSPRAAKEREGKGAQA